MLWSPENPEIIQEARNNQQRAFEIVQDTQARSYEQIATFPVQLLQDTSDQIFQQLYRDPVQSENLAEENNIVDTLKDREVVPLNGLDISMGQSQLVEIDNRQYEIGLSPKGEVYMRNNGSTYTINNVKADKGTIFFRAAAFFGPNSTAGVLKYQGYDVENVSRLWFEGNELYADYLRRGLEKDEHTGREVERERRYEGLSVPLEALYALKKAVDSQQQQFYVDKDTIQKVAKDAEKYYDRIGPDGQAILEPDDLDGIGHISRIKVGLKKEKSH